MSIPWRKLRPWLTAAFLLLVASVIAYAAQAIEWSKVWASLRRLPPWKLALAAALSSLSYLGYSCTDLFAAGSMEGRVSKPRAMLIAFVSYAFNQNFGALLGTIGFRLRLYSHHGLAAASIARIIGLSFLTNWSGYFLLAGLAFLASPPRLPHGWELGGTGLRCVGAALLAILLAYFACCALLRRREWRLPRMTIELPHWRTVLLQLALSLSIWLSIAATVYTLLPAGPDPMRVLAVFLLASVAGLIAHVPGGLGVIEAVFVALLAGEALPRHDILAVLIAYRAVYYLWPLLPAAALYAWLEASARALPAPAPPGRPRQARQH